MMHLFVYVIGYFLALIALKAHFEKESYHPYDSSGFAVIWALFWPISVPFIYAIKLGEYLGEKK